MISRASAPGKVILFGEHFVVHGTRAILAAINRRITVTSRITGEPTVSIRSDLGECEVDAGPPPPGGGGAAPPELRPFEFLARKMIGEFAGGGGGGGRAGIRMEIESEIPRGAGLGSSSASCVAAACSVSRLFTAGHTRDDICRMAIEAERTIFENTSGADCTACAHGGVILYGRGAGFERIGPGPGMRLVISDSGIARSTGEVAARVARFRDRDPERFGSICARESALIDRAVSLIRRGDHRALGEAMRENQRHLRDIRVSSGALEDMIRVADSCSFGSKITGAGGGGCIVSMADAASAGRVAEALRGGGIRSFAAEIDHSGLEAF